MQTPHPLDGVRMRPVDRASAKAEMDRAELIIDLVASGVSKMRSVLSYTPALVQRVNSLLFPRIAGPSRRRDIA